jgi:Flp pilus assembly protein TadG
MKRAPLKKLVRGNNRGSIMVMTAIAVVALFSFAALAIDGAMMMTTKNQLQAAADAAALAGASALLDNGDQAEARARAIAFSSYNSAVQDTPRPVTITDADITFPEPDVIRVTTHRTLATGDALRTYFLRIVDPGSNNLTDVTATAAARAYDVCSAACIKPWAIPDKWDDLNGNGALDAGEYDPVTTGYVAPDDVGLQVVLKLGNPQDAISPGQFFPVDLPPIDCSCGVDPQPGGDAYRDNIAECNPYPVHVGDRLLTENGNMVGPTKQGMEALINADPGAYWSEADGAVRGSRFGMSPRIALVPFFDPTNPPASGKQEVTIVKLAAFFLEDVFGGQVRGRFIGAMVQGGACVGGNGSSFLTGITLVE